MDRLSLLFFKLAERLWGAVRALARALIGEERLGRLLEASGLRALKSRVWRLETTLPDGNRLLYRPHDQCIIDEIYSQKVYGPDDAIKPGQTVVDVGGHIGIFALYAARKVGPSGRVIACEPGPENLALLMDNVARNGLTQVSIRPFALSDHEGEAELFIPDSASDNPAANTLFATPGRKSVLVPLRTLDRIVQDERLARIDHLKIDVEGSELAVLKGAARTLAITRRIVLELHPGRTDPGLVVDLLKTAGFRCRVLPGRDRIVEALK